MLAKSSIFIVSIGISFTSGDNDDDDEDVVRIGRPVIGIDVGHEVHAVIDCCLCIPDVDRRVGDVHGFGTVIVRCMDITGVDSGSGIVIGIGVVHGFEDVIERCIDIPDVDGRVDIVHGVGTVIG